MIIDEQVIFIHNPRAAGTSVRRALLHGADPNAAGNIPYPGNVASAWTQNQKHAFAGMVRGAIPVEVWESRFKLAIVRNPFERLVSLYGLFRRPLERVGMGLPDRASVWKRQTQRQPYKLNKLILAISHPDVHRDISKAAKFNLHRVAFECDFKTWLLVFCETYCWNGCKYLDRERPLTRIQQVEWFEGLDAVFKFEEMDALRDCLSGRGYRLPVPENATEHAPWQSYYDAETYDWAAAAFKDDIERFRYE